MRTTPLLRLAACLLAVTSSGQGAAGRTLVHDWNSPIGPGTEVLYTASETGASGGAREDWPVLPEGRAGWARWLGNVYADMYAVGDGVVVIGGTSSDPMTAYRLSDGELIWIAPSVGMISWMPEPGISQNTLIGEASVNGGGLGWERGVRGISLEDGQPLWDRAEVKLLAITAAGAWVCDRKPGNYGSQQDDDFEAGACSNLILLDAPTGAVLHRWDVGLLLGYTKQLPQHSTQFAVATADELLVCSADGSTQRAARRHPRWPARLALDAKGVVEQAHPAIPNYDEVEAGWKALSEKHGESYRTRENYQAYYQTTKHYAAAMTGYTEYFALPGLVSQWHQAVDRSGRKATFYGAAYLEAALTPTQVLLLGWSSNSLEALSRETGAEEAAPLEPLEHTAFQIHGSFITAEEDSGMHGDPTLEPTRLLVLNTGLTAELPHPPTTKVTWFHATPGYLAYITDENPVRGLPPEAPHINDALVVLRLDESFQPIPGELQRIGAPLEADEPEATASEEGEALGWPELPNGEGWARFLGKPDYDEVVAQTAELVIVKRGLQDSAQLLAFHTADGSPAWRADDTPVTEDGAQLVGDVLVGHGYHDGGWGWHGMSSIDGRTLWSRQDITVHGVNSAGVWASRPLERPAEAKKSDLEEGLYPDLLLLDLHSGTEVHPFSLGRLYGLPLQFDPAGRDFAVATRDAVVLAHADGTTQSAARSHPGRESRLALDATGILEHVHPPIPEYDFDKVYKDNPNLTEEEANDKFLASDYYKATQTAELHYYSLPGLKERWSHNIGTLPETGCSGDEPASVKPALLPDMAMAVGCKWAAPFERSQGKALPLPAEFVVRSEETYVHLDVRDGWLAVRNDNPEASRRKTVRFRLDGQPTATLANSDGTTSTLLATGGHVCFMTTQYGPTPYADAAPTEGVALVCLNVKDGQVLAGTPRKLGGPQTHHGLIEKFHSMPNPLADKLFMARLTTSGKDALNRLWQATGLDRPRHLDSLMRATADAMAQGRIDGGEQLAGYYLERLGPSAEPKLVAWAEDESLWQLRPALELALLRSLGPVARKYIKRTFAIPSQQPLTATGPPWKLRDLWNTKTAEEAGFQRTPEGEPAAYSSLQWASQTADDGTTYAAAQGLGFGLAIAVDKGGDGTFEEFLPTGLEDRCSAREMWMPEREFCSGAGVQLSLNLPRLTVQHHRPRYGIVREHGYEREEMTGAEYIASTLKLDQLRRDSDRDGLTDIMERMLALDPERADTDGDGLADALDPTPNANPARMGKLARGMARLLYAQDRQRELDVWRYGPHYWQRPASGVFDVNFPLLEDMEPIAYAPYGTRTVWLTSEFAATNELGRLRPTYDSYYAGLAAAEDLSFEHSDRRPGSLYFSVDSFYGCIRSSPIEMVEIDGELYPVLVPGRM